MLKEDGPKKSFNPLLSLSGRIDSLIPVLYPFQSSSEFKIGDNLVLKVDSFTFFQSSSEFKWGIQRRW